MPLSLYIHYPFCTNLCHYCDFYKIKYLPESESQYFDALDTEIRLAGESVSPHERLIDTIYIGGGTPSLASTLHLKKLLRQIRERFQIADNLEFSFEINPESMDADRLLFLRELGVNRPIFGLQSFDRKILKLLNRKHDLDHSAQAIYLARAIGFDNFGIDMIFGLPRQTTKRLSADLAQLLEFNPPHISYYQLTVEKGTGLEKKIENGEINVPDSDFSAAMYQAITTELEKNGYNRYEISSFARPGFECRHNMKYWEGGEFLGLGPSAHSFIKGQRFANIPDFKIYIDRLNHFERPLVFDVSDKKSRIYESIMLGLRTSKGINRDIFQSQFGIPVEQAVDIDSFRAVVDRGLVDPEGDFIKLTPAGFPLADEIIRRLVR